MDAVAGPGMQDALTTGDECDIIVRKSGLVAFSYACGEKGRQKVFCRVGPDDTIWFKAGSREVELGKEVVLQEQGVLVIVLPATIE